MRPGAMARERVLYKCRLAAQRPPKTSREGSRLSVTAVFSLIGGVKGFIPVQGGALSTAVYSAAKLPFPSVTAPT